MLFVYKPFIWNIVRMKRTLAEVRNERKTELSSCICIDWSQVIVIVVFPLGCLSVYVIYFWILCSVLSSIFVFVVVIFLLEVSALQPFRYHDYYYDYDGYYY